MKEGRPPRCLIHKPTHIAKQCQKHDDTQNTYFLVTKLWHYTSTSSLSSFSHFSLEGYYMLEKHQPSGNWDTFCIFLSCISLFLKAVKNIQQPDFLSRLHSTHVILEARPLFACYVTNQLWLLP